MRVATNARITQNTTPLLVFFTNKRNDSNKVVVQEDPQRMTPAHILHSCIRGMCGFFATPLLVFFTNKRNDSSKAVGQEDQQRMTPAHVLHSCIRGMCIFLVLLNFSSCKTNSSEDNQQTTTKSFVFGADLSYALQMKDQGTTYTYNGTKQDIFSLFHAAGCQSARIRLWHTPSKYVSTWGGNDQQYNSYTQAEQMIAQAKAAGMTVLLDFHYSDTWADPQKQFIPDAWKNLSLDVMKDSVYQYTLNVLKKLAQKNLTPEYVQIGNETNVGMLWDVGKIINNNFANYSALTNSGIKAVRDFSKTSTIQPKIILHVAQLDNAQWWLSGLTGAGTTDFDIVGLSHYSNWSTVNTMDGVQKAIAALITLYKKQVMVVETAYWWNTNDQFNYPIGIQAVSGYPFTKDGQKKYLIDLTQALINGGCSGIFYWAPDYYNKTTGGELNARSLFDYTQTATPALDYMNQKYTTP